MTLCGHGLWAQGERELLQVIFIKCIDLDWTGQGIRVEGRYSSPHPSSIVLSLSTNSSLQWIWDHTHTYRWTSEKKQPVESFSWNISQKSWSQSIWQFSLQALSSRCPRSPNPAVQVRLHQHSQLISSRSRGSGSRPAAVRLWGLGYPQERPHSGTRSPKAVRGTGRRRSPGFQPLPQALRSAGPSGRRGALGDLGVGSWK